MLSIVTIGLRYLEGCEGILTRIREQLPLIEEAAEWFSESIGTGRVVHLFGSGHSRIMVEEMWPRYGSFPGFNPIVELSLSYHNLVVGANGQRQAMFLENTAGLAERILRNFVIDEGDSGLVISSSGCNVVPIEMAKGFHDRGLRVVAMISRRHSDASRSSHPKGWKVQDFADLVLDTGAPVGDAMVRPDGSDLAVSPGSTIGGCLIVNTLKAEIAQRLVSSGRSPLVLSASAVVGKVKSEQLFEAAYDEHARLLSRLFDQPVAGDQGRESGE